jgi:hypothetical protein
MSYDDYNDKHNFTFRFDSNDGERHLEMNVNELYLYDIFARFKEFLQGCGYEINGEIEVVEYNSERDYDSGYTLTETPKHEPKFDFSNIPNNNWPFGESKSASMPKHSEHGWNEWNNSYSLTTDGIPSLTTFDLTQIKPIDLSSLTVTNLETGEVKPHSEWAGLNKYPTMAPLSSEQIQSWTTEMPGTLGSAKYNWSQYEGR